MKSLESKGIDFKSAISWIQGSMLVVLMGHGFQVRNFNLMSAFILKSLENLKEKRDLLCVIFFVYLCTYILYEQ